tara:strand:+ start:528 stop:680 length:153 start_codon:yes stop_codon:yes gene_type:complete
MKKNSQAGKGDKPRNCFSNGYKNNYDSINWEDDKKCANASSAKKTTQKSH